MKKTIIIAVLSLLSVGAQAQFSVNYSVGYADYKMGDMKDIMKIALETGITSGELPEGLKLVDNFPAYVTHNVDLGYQLGRMHEFGIKTSYLTTGAKIAYSDYSGKYEEKATLNGYRVGLVYRNHFYTMNVGNHSLSFFGELSPAATFTKFKTKGKLELYEGNVNVQADSEADLSISKTSFSIQPLAGARFKLYDHFLFTVSGGYDFEFGAKLASRSAYRIDWSGMRLNAGVGYMF